MARAAKTLKTYKDSAVFDVIGTPVYIDKDGEKQQIMGKKAIVRTDTGSVLSVLSDRYIPVSNGKVLETFTEMADAAGITWQRGQNYLIGDGRKTFMEILFPNHSFSAGKLPSGKDDVINMKGWLTNSFDGYYQITFTGGSERLICTNGALGFAQDLSISHRHVGQVTEKLVSAFKTFLGKHIDSNIESVKHLNRSYFAESDAVAAVIDGSNWMGQKYQQDLKLEWAQESKPTLAWQVYNVYTKVITHNVKANQEAKMALYKHLNQDVSTKWKVETK